jgi:hypothetical protein
MSFFINMCNLVHNGGVGGVVRHFHLHQVDLRAGGAQARQLIYTTQLNSLVDPGCLSRIPDQNFFHPRSASKNLNILTPKNGFSALGNMIRVVHPGSRLRNRFATFYPSRIPDLGIKKAYGIKKEHNTKDTA